jgi:hypothetical protein
MLPRQTTRTASCCSNHFTHVMGASTPAQFLREIARSRARNSGWFGHETRRRDHSRLSCGGGGHAARACDSLQPLASRARCSSPQHRCDGQPIGAFSVDPEMIGSGKISNSIAHFALDFARKESVCVSRTPSLTRLAPFPASADGLRGVWVVAARCCAGTYGTMLCRHHPKE